MKTGQNISHHWRLLWTSLALLLVLSVNHQVLPAYAHTATPAEQTAVKAHKKAEGTIVKQRVSLEATTSFVDLVLAEPALLPTFSFTAPEALNLKMEAPLAYWTFFLQQQATQPISPNAP
ncbi:RNA methyltransferase [Rufibacter sp. DG15C]|uniref:RNA methyltransferase n=1 Tax=Rufibacter sp. DG15C TaxID=1379909 RepID=UPI000A4A57CA|nr:RNA methyltransferase [Rufibacter sp. DG15C]